MKILTALVMTLPLLAQERILIDTDCGFFGDDGTTIAMLLRSSKFRVEAITTVSGNVWSRQTAQYTLEILKLMGASRIPVYMGAELPLVHTPGMAEQAHQKWGPIEFRGAFAEKLPPTPPAGIRKSNAVEYLIRALDASPGQIAIVALGPFTNIAMALRLRPDIAAKIKRLVFMGGQFRVAGNASKEAEFNFWFDPEAAQIVLRSAIREKVMFGLDVCNLAMLDKRGFDEIVQLRTPITERFRADFGERYPGFARNPDAKVSLWDALVAAWMIDPALFSKPESLYLDVDTRFAPAYGKVVELDRKLAPEASPVQMMNALDYPQVFALFRDLLQKRR
ncbi:MAG: nucleoside hydrolase [Bryobacterales bacterium]|nr:nucleoside hydrolase [Bryobacterales bacterium]